MLTLEQQPNRVQSSYSANPARPDRTDSRPASMGNPLIARQQSLGNQAVQRMLRSKAIQAKPAINKPGDEYEQEADRVAEAVMRVPGLQTRQENASSTLNSFASAPNVLQRKCACGGTPGTDGECAECRAKRLSLQHYAAGYTAPTTATHLVHEVLNSPGQPLDPATRAFMEPRFGHDFSQVRVHSDARAAESARAVGARAYTVGHDIVFGVGQYRADHPAGAYLLAHELAHVRQAGAAGRPNPLQAYSDESSGKLAEIMSTSTNIGSERQAWRMAQAVISGARVSEAPIPASGAQLAPQTGAVGGLLRLPPNTQPKQPERSRGIFAEPGTMKALVEKWHKAGLLDSPFRPVDVPPISPVPHPSEIVDVLSPEVQAEIADEFNKRFYGEETVVLGGVMGGLGMESPPGLGLPPGSLSDTPSPGPSTPPTSSPPTGTRPPITGPTTGTRPPISVRPPGGQPRGGHPILVVGIPLALAAAPHLAEWWFRRTHPEYNWEGKTNPITGRPVESLAEYQWLQSLTEPQLEYLRMLYDAQSLYPEPAAEEPDVLAKPDPTVQARIRAALQEELQEQEEGGKRRRRRCIKIHGPRMGGGDKRHDSYAMKVSNSPINEDYYVHTGELLPYLVAYDGLDGYPPGSNLVWEVKTGYGFVFNPDIPALQTLMAWEQQKEKQLYVARRCNLRLHWSIGARDPSSSSDVNTAKALANTMNEIWKGKPPVFSKPG